MIKSCRQYSAQRRLFQSAQRILPQNINDEILVNFIITVFIDFIQDIIDFFFGGTIHTKFFSDLVKNLFKFSMVQCSVSIDINFVEGLFHDFFHFPWILHCLLIQIAWHDTIYNKKYYILSSQYIFLYKKYCEQSITSMLKILSSFGASSSFEKHRLILTTDNLEAPDQYSLKKLLQTFHGEDDQTRPQFAFAIITKKILTSEKKESWIYLLKNILILDRVLEDLCFVEQIASLELNTVDNYIETSSKYHEINTSQFIKKCWKLIKYKATLLSSKKHILFFSRSQRAQFLQTLNPPEILQQIQTIEQLFLLSFSIITNFRHYSDTQSLRKSRLSLEKTPLIQYLYLQILYKLISFYSSELLCVNKMLFFITKDSTLNIIPLKLLKKFKASLQKFKQNSSSLITFVQKNKEIKGFEDVNYREFDPILESDLIQKIDLYIDEKVNGNTRENSIQNYVGHSHERISVHLQSKNSLLSNDEISHQPRRKLACKRADGDLNNPFSNWIPNYSEDFPQQQIMTLDLIMILKEENKSGKIQEQILIYPERETFVVEEGIQIGFFRKPSPHDSLKYENLYSSLESVWNS